MKLIDLIGVFVLQLLVLLSERRQLRLVLQLQLFNFALQLLHLAVALPVELQLMTHYAHTQIQSLRFESLTKELSTAPCNASFAVESTIL
jgi:hypothetical protein